MVSTGEYIRVDTDGFMPTQEHAPTKRLGDVLREVEAITDAQLDWALEVQQQSGSPLGTILVASGAVDRLTVYRALSEVWGYPFVDCATTRVDPALLDGARPDDVMAQQWIPLHRDRRGRIQVATARQPTASLRDTIEARLGEPVDLLVTTDWDLGQAVSRAFEANILDEASLGLWRRAADRSAHHVLSKPQGVIVALLLVAVIGVIAVAPLQTLVVISWLIGVGFFVSVLFKFLACFRGAQFENIEGISQQDLDDLDETGLPVYTVLVPVYKEAAVLPNLMRNLAALDYPTAKLDIIVLLEDGDTETWDAARAMHPPGNVRLLRIPPGAPQTKPKACNVGLLFARGEYLVIYDAEDRPNPDQLKKSVIAFRRGDSRLVCVQAALNYFNANENALTRMFTSEYSFWFDYMLPGLDSLRLPIPLGGTSNHFRTDMLRELGGWDPFNVTEDADLGIRAAAMGYTVSVINSTTFEEANNRYGNFIRQRSRWIKGYLQTTLVHLRHPIRLTRMCGIRQVFGFGLLVGGTPVTFLAVPPLYLLFLISLFVPADDLRVLFPGWVLWISLVNLLVGSVLMIYVAMMGAFKRQQYGLVLWALANPAYWLLHAIAAYKALWQLITRPHYWEKTVHGLTTYADADAGADTDAGAGPGSEPGAETVDSGADSVATLDGDRVATTNAAPPQRTAPPRVRSRGDSTMAG